MDVDSHAIRALVFKLGSRDTEPKIVKKITEKIRMASGGMRTAAKTKEIAFSLLTFLEAIPEEVVVSLGPSVAEYAISNWEMHLKKPYTEEYLERQFAAAAHAESTENRNIIAADPLRFELDGSPIPLAKALEASEGNVSVKTCAAFLSKELFHAFINIKSIAEKIPLHFVPSLSSVALGVVQSQKVENAIIVQVNDAETVVMAVSAGGLLGFSVFSPGAANFTHRVSEYHGFAREEARDTIRQIAYGIGFAGDNQKIVEETKTVFDVWKTQFLKALEALYVYGPFSGDIFLLGEGAYILPIRAYLGQSEWLGDISYAENPRLRVLDASMFFGGKTFGGALTSAEDAELAALLYRVLFYKPLFGYNKDDIF